MRRPIAVRPLSDDERQQLVAALRSSAAFTLRRAQIILASARGVTPRQIAHMLGCDDQTVRDAIAAFNDHGMASLQRHQPTPHAVLTLERLTQLRALLHRSPRDFGHDMSLWTLELAAQEAARQGITPRRVTAETIRAALAAQGIRWLRAKQWITNPDPEYMKNTGDTTV